MNYLQKFGLHGELWAKEQLESRGYSVHIPTDFFEPCKDLVINGVLCCEVKISNPGKRRVKIKSGYGVYPRWKWEVSSITSKDRIVILIASTDSGNFAFICPSALFVDRVNVEITNDPTMYKGYLSAFLNNWSTVDYLLNKCYKTAQQLDLFAESEEAA